MASGIRRVVNGELGQRSCAAFEGVTDSIHNGTTEISGAVIGGLHR
jgi:hypothetical protein